MNLVDSINVRLKRRLPHNHVLRRAVRFVRGRKVRPLFNAYVAAMTDDNPLRRCDMSLVGDCSADPTEFFNYYDAFAYWEAEKLKKLGDTLDILDIGNKKATNAIVSVQHNITSIVLADCKDDISKVRYLIHDVSDPLPLQDSSFDIFTSTATLHLIGLARYGDKLNPNALPDLIKELDRVMRPQSDLMIAIPLGNKNHLSFNNGWVFTLNTLNALFSKWRLTDYLIDNTAVANTRYTERFTKSLDTLQHLLEGESRVVFLHFKRPTPY
jgi:hypothetical protein